MLPSIDGLCSLAPGLLRAFRARLLSHHMRFDHIGALLAPSEGIPPFLRRPVRAFHLRRRHEPAALALRMLTFEDPVAREEARVVLGDLLDPLVAAGLLVERDGGLVSPFLVSILDDQCILSDHLSRGGEAAMGMGATTAKLIRASVPRGRVDRALDLGCGAGAVALALSRFSRHVVATDVSPRALALARLNAQMNGRENIELREGDLFEPVKGETFDLVVSQPPFLAKPDAVPGASALYGGARGDELPLRLLSGLPAHLANDGKAVLFIEWALLGDDPIEARVRGALGDDVDLLVLRSPDVGVDRHAASYAAAKHATLGAEFDREALALLEHFETLGVRALAETFLVVRARERSSGEPFTHVVPVGAQGCIDITMDRVERLLAARDLVGDRERLLAANVRFPDGTVLSEEQDGPGADRPSIVRARFADAALIEPAILDKNLLILLTCVHEADTVRAGVERFAEAYDVPFEHALDRALAAIEGALLAGLVEVAEIGRLPSA